MNASPAEVREWLEKARDDLVSGRILLEHLPPVLETAAFHCQQSAEKALKAYLIWRGIPFDRVHNLTYLLDLCEAEDTSFSSIRADTSALTPFAVGIRYPTARLVVAPRDARNALAAAEAAWDLVLSLLPDECRPDVGRAAPDAAPGPSTT